MASENTVFFFDAHGALWETCADDDCAEPFGPTGTARRVEDLPEATRDGTAWSYFYNRGQLRRGADGGFDTVAPGVISVRMTEGGPERSIARPDLNVVVAVEADLCDGPSSRTGWVVVFPAHPKYETLRALDWCDVRTADSTDIEMMSRGFDAYSFEDLGEYEPDYSEPAVILGPASEARAGDIRPTSASGGIVVAMIRELHAAALRAGADPESAERLRVAVEVEDWETAAWYAAVLGMDVLADACIDASPKDGPFRKEWVDGVRARAMGEV